MRRKMSLSGEIPLKNASFALVIRFVHPLSLYLWLLGKEYGMEKELEGKERQKQ